MLRIILIADNSQSNLKILTRTLAQNFFRLAFLFIYDLFRTILEQNYSL